MDAQLKKGLLDQCVLAVLNKEDSYGYEIISKLSKVVEVSESTLYPILRRLEASGMLSTYNVEHSHRFRKYYRITELGRYKLFESHSDWRELTKIYQFIIGKE